MVLTVLTRGGLVTLCVCVMLIWLHIGTEPFQGSIGKARQIICGRISMPVPIIRTYADQSALEATALKAAMILPTLVLQKPFRTSKSKDHIACMERRMDH